MGRASRGAFGALSTVLAVVAVMRWLFTRRRPVEVSRVGITDAAFDGQKPESRNRRAVLGVLLVLALLLTAIGFAIWPGFGFLDRYRIPTGGVLLLHDRLTFDSESDAVAGLRAEIAVEIWDTGSPGVSIAEITIRFQSPRPEDHWYLVASGDWAVPPDRLESLYCKYGEGKFVGDRVRCAAQVGNPAMEFRFDQELGNALSTTEITDSVVDLQGYDRERVTVVSGSMLATRDDGEAVVEAWLPISSPPIFGVGGDEYLALPPLAWTGTSLGIGPPLEEPCEIAKSERVAPFALTGSCAPITPVQVTRSSVDAGVAIGSRTVEYASPDTVSDDAARWAAEGGFPGAQALIRDPFAQADESRRAFLAALLLSGGVSFLLLFAERLLFHPSNRDSRRRST
jgi:hypothetical protein